MFSKRKGVPNARFYCAPANMEVVHSGYMFKSPPEHLMKSLNSWKRRYFVLSRDPQNQYELKFFKDENKKDKTLGNINIYHITLISRKMKSESIWLWIQKNFKCPADCVLYMKVPQREYFLIGENSTEMDEWFDVIFKALNTHVFIQADTEQLATRTTRSISEPPKMTWYDHNVSEEQEQKVTDPNPVRKSAPESFNSQYSHYDYPKKFLMKASLSQDTDEDEDDEVKVDKEYETEVDSNVYMDMESVKEILEQVQIQRDVPLPKTILEGNRVPENQCHPISTIAENTTDPNRQLVQRSETPFTPVEKDICISQDELRNSVVFSEKAGEICISNRNCTPFSSLLLEGDQILAINNLRTDSLVELETYLKKLTKDQVKVTIRRQSGSHIAHTTGE